MKEIYWNALTKLCQQNGELNELFWTQRIRLDLYICTGIITLLLIALIVIVLIKKK